MKACPAQIFRPEPAVRPRLKSGRRAVLALVACLSLASGPACLKQQFSDLDTANGGLLGALLIALASSTMTTYLAFDDTLVFHTSLDRLTWTATTANGPTGGLDLVRHGGGQTLWGVDKKAADNLVRSDDFGATWSDVTIGIPRRYKTLAVCGDTIFMTINTGTDWDAIYSNDGGTTWNSANIDTPGTFTIQDAGCSDSNRLFAVKSNSPPIFFSTDGGASWTMGANGSASTTSRAAVRPNSNELLLAAEVPPATLTKSTDLATSYATADTATLTGDTFSGGMAADANNFYVTGRAGSSCNLYTSATGNSGSFNSRSFTCGPADTITQAASDGTNIIFGGFRSGLVPSVYSVSLDSNTTSNINLTSAASGSTITTLLAVTQ